MLDLRLHSYFKDNRFFYINFVQRFFCRMFHKSEFILTNSSLYRSLKNNSLHLKKSASIKRDIRQHIRTMEMTKNPILAANPLIKVK